MLQKMRGNTKGFTLIELMIVIAIIGILAAIAIPNFIAYRDKAFCSAAENDARSIAAEIADYFAIPSHVATPALTDLNIDLSGDNSASISGGVNNISIVVTDGSERCPDEYMDAQDDWDSGTRTFTKVM
jgi:prepilin-type N-terminal cleavage/methylation domain-containing protein